MHKPLDTELVINIKGGWDKKRGGWVGGGFQNKSRFILDRITLDLRGFDEKHGRAIEARILLILSVPILNTHIYI